jgi:hypothetical protein
MKKSSADLSLAFNAQRANLPQIIVIVIVLSLVLGMLLTDTSNEMVASLVTSLFQSIAVMAIFFWSWSAFKATKAAAATRYNKRMELDWRCGLGLARVEPSGSARIGRG